MPSTLDAIDLFAGLADPYPLYRELREQNDGVHFVEPVGMWLVLRYADGQRLASERQRWSSNYFNSMGMGTYTAGDSEHERYARIMSRNLMMNDAPDHTRLRKLLNHAFTGRATHAWDSVISDIVDSVLDGVVPGEPIDAFRDLGEVIPLMVIAKLLGVPVDDRERFRDLSVSFASTLDPGNIGEARDTAIRRSLELFDLVGELADRAEREPQEGLLGALVSAEEEDAASLSRDELVAQVCMLLAAGNETTADLIATGTALLLEHPAQLELLREDRSLLEPALHEILRYKSPLQFSPRVTADDIDDLGPKTIPRGSHVLFGHGSANRDPRQYDRPEEFDITRGDRRHLAFASGAHFCIGNQLALTEGKIYFSKFLDRFGAMEAAGDPVPRCRFQQHGYASVPLVVTE